MKTIAPGIQQWSFFSQEKQLDFNGLLLTVNDHCILVDPPPMEAADRTAILKGHPVDYILLTNRDHVREVEACRRLQGESLRARGRRAPDGDSRRQNL